MCHAGPGGQRLPLPNPPPPPPPPPPLATALNAGEEGPYFGDNINFWNIFPAERKTLLLSRGKDNTYLKWPVGKVGPDSGLDWTGLDFF